MTDSTENATSPKFSDSKNSDSLPSRNTNFSLIRICTEAFGLCDLVDFFSIFSGTCHTEGRDMQIVMKCRYIFI